MNEIRIEKKNEQVAMRISAISIGGNVVLSILKLFAGIVAKSGAMVSDAVHSLSDVFSTLIVIVGIKWAAKESDTDHPYGHEKFESVASMFLAMMLFATAILIGYNGIEALISGDYAVAETPGKLALVAAVISVVVKEWMYLITKKAAKQINSGALLADAWHHHTDALSSIGSFVGILAARMGFMAGDAIASLLICLMILHASYEIMKDALDKMLDKSWDNESVEAMRAAILSNEEVIRIDDLKTRLFGPRVYAEVEITVHKYLSFVEAHDVAEKVHRDIERRFADIKHCMVHVNPCKCTNPNMTKTVNS